MQLMCNLEIALKPVLILEDTKTSDSFSKIVIPWFIKCGDKQSVIRSLSHSLSPLNYDSNLQLFVY